MARPQRITDDTILHALAGLGEATSEELAAQMGIGQSTAAKRLAALESAALTRRQPGGRVNGVRAADRWAATAAAGNADAGKPTPDGPEGVEANGHEANGDDASAASEKEPDAAPAAEETAASADRLGRGALGALVRDYLAARPDDDLGPTQVGKALGRSQGAVANLCGSSVSSATVEEVAEALGISRSAAGKALADLEREEQVVRSAGGREDGRRLPDRWRLAVRGSEEGKVRLGRGQLREMVVGHLQGHPGAVSPAQLSKTLGHSAGAISNVLVKLAGVGEVVQTSEHPRRYAAPQVS